MVLMGDSKRRKEICKYSGILASKEGSNPMSDEEDVEKLRLMSELNSQIGGNDLDDDYDNNNSD
jgi:hypothetical protein